MNPTAAKILSAAVQHVPETGSTNEDALARAAPTCLLCFERDPARCHRRVLAERLEARGFVVSDLFG